MDIEKIKEVIELMNEHGLVEIELSDGEQTIRLRKAEAPSEPAKTQAPEETAEKPAEEAKSGTPEGCIQITAPMVGTFYRASAPDADPYVEIGDKVHPETVVCIIEAMKVMNEIKAEVEGEVVDILVENGDVVEFGQPLFLIKPTTPTGS
ncbi:MAG: acetyl-CoA carboxylase biotin carboxyl carrier protein [Thermoplasmata archaeon]|nr:MAG: acetyl-CoA carboxylase biotin carboxyl carrier protein [Thermoplasmata archaeon]